ncbi:hypothetical protein SEA_EASLEY_53 [Gordonia phage Easley]|uniref:Uncharacterized protein n=1 Tax=Gordonia phage Easley TaxID=2182395 RepID=A0A2U8UMW3_9CAUD|nr:hypothetical protein PP510_gp53 [Gordonia phage Easley]AWN05077.1 hypothetical protein SEA_EASLEY_53 [Gordonia phage Easley]
MSTQPVPILQVDADPGIFPDDRPTTFTDGYGGSQVLVPIEQLRAAEARIRELEAEQLVDHTDPEQLRRAAGVIEGLGMDDGVEEPHLWFINALNLRAQADEIEASRTSWDDVIEQAARTLFDAVSDKPEVYEQVRHHWIRYAQVLADANLLARAEQLPQLPPEPPTCGDLGAPAYHNGHPYRCSRNPGHPNDHVDGRNGITWAGIPGHPANSEAGA